MLEGERQPGARMRLPHRLLVSAGVDPEDVGDPGSAQLCVEPESLPVYQAFLTAGGHIGLQHDPLLYGAYLLNPFLVRVEMVPMLVTHGYIGPIILELRYLRALSLGDPITLMGESYAALRGILATIPPQ